MFIQSDITSVAVEILTGEYEYLDLLTVTPRLSALEALGSWLWTREPWMCGGRVRGEGSWRIRLEWKQFDALGRS